MKYKLTAFEFIAASSEPCIVQIFRGPMPLMQFAFIDWIAVDLSPFNYEFEQKEQLIIKGMGLGHPYWDNELPPWMMEFDPRAEARRIQMIKTAAAREINAVRIAQS